MSNVKFKKLQSIKESLNELETNKNVQEYLGLQKQLLECESDVKEYARTSGEEYSSDVVSIKVSQVFKKEYDYSILKKIAKPNIMVRIDEITTKKIDKKKFDKMVEDGIIPAKLAQESFSEEQGTSKIFIKYLT